jgi:DNA-binding LytR/AlgR family response regulator
MSDSITVLIVDDEPLARRRLQLALNDIPHAQCVGLCKDGEDAVAQIRAKAPQVLLLDVKMPIKDGFDVIDACVDLNPAPEFIFVTAFDHFAVRAFDARAIDYLLKPIEFDRLAAALERAREAHRARGAQSRISELSEVVAALRTATHMEEKARYEREFWIKDRGQWIRVPVESIDWVEAERDYMRLHCGARSYLLRVTMAALEGALDPEEWMRVHRSCLVRRTRVGAVRRTASGGLVVRLSTGAEVRVGRAYASAVTHEMMQPGRPGLAARVERTAEKKNDPA